MSTTEKTTAETAKAKESAYNKAYYAKRKEAIAKARRAKYKNDPTYREKAKLRSKRQYHTRTRPARMAERGPSYPATALNDLKPVGSIDVKVGTKKSDLFGQSLTVGVFSTASLSALLGRSGQTLRQWEKSGVIPEPAWRGQDVKTFVSKGRNPRLYTRDELAVIEENRSLLDLPAPRLSESVFAKKVTEGFKALYRGVKLAS